MSLSSPPQGSLEDLFRHHLLESEAAAVPPRPQVWEQLDNSLLLAQNEKYRRRLRVHRWAVAASLLLATLASGGWWHSQQQAPTLPLAQATRSGSEALRSAGRAAHPGYPATSQSTAALPTATVAPSHSPALASSAGLAGSGTVSSPSTSLAIVQPATSLSLSTTPAGKLAASSMLRPVNARAAGYSPQASLAVASPAGAGTIAEPGAAGRMTAYGTGSAWAGAAVNAGAVGTSPELAAMPTTPAEALPSVATPATLASQAVATAGALATRPARLALAASPHLPGSLSALALPEQPAPTVARRWQYGLDYATSAYQPNIDFAKEPSTYNTALGFASANMTKAAAAEYRNNLRAGLGQRLSLWAARRLGNGRWSLRTGLELAQNSAHSASSVAFVGEQVADLSYTVVTPARLQPTSYRYRSASVPVELRYGNPAKTGFSFYSRVGGLLTALLNVHSEVEGNAEATRSYSLTSSGSPYRRVSASLRGGAGMQYRPTGHQWALSLGPVAEAGILSLNTDPTQSFWGQKRPYSFGLEAGVELGRLPRVVQ